MSLVAVLLMVGSVVASDSMIGYRSNTGSCATNLLNCPKVREWDSTAGTWGSEAELATAGSPVREAVMRQSPVSSKKVLVTQSDDGYLDAYVCTNNCGQASSWVVTNNVGQVWSAAPGTHSRRFDVEFETSTGDAVLVFGALDTVTTRDVGYKVLPAGSTTWGSLNYIDDSGHATDIQYSWIALARDPVSSSQELTLVGFDSTDSDINAWVWSGSSFGNFKELTAAATATGGREALAVEYEADGGNALAMAGDSTSGNIKYSAWNGAAWSSVFSFDIDSGDTLNAQWLSLKADPSTDDLQLVVVDSGADLHTAYSNGATWTVTSNIDAQVDSATTRPADFAWEPTGNKGLLVWDTDGAGTTLSYRGCTPQCTGTTKTASGFDGTGAWLGMSTNPTSTDSVKIIGTRLNSNSDGGAFKYTGSIIEFSETAISTDLSGIGFEGGLWGGSFALAAGLDDDALVAYYSGNVVSGNVDCDTVAEAQRCPRVKVWDADANAGVGEWSTSEVVLPTMGGTNGGVKVITLKHSPVSSRVIVAAVDQDGLLDVYVCNGFCDQASSWTKTNNDLADLWSTVPNPGQNRFDVDFESTSGDALLVYAPNDATDANDLMYVTLSASSSTWSAPTSEADSSGGTADLQYSWISLARNPTNDEILVAGIDSTDSDANAWVWSGSALGNEQEIATGVTATLGGEALATAWADDGTKGMVVVGDGTTGDVKWATWTPGSPGSWSAVSTFDVNSGDSDDVVWMTLKADPATDDLMAVFLAEAGVGWPLDLHTARWGGSSWDSPVSNHVTASTSVMRWADFAWEPTGSSGKLVWDDGVGTDTIYSKAWTGSWGLATATATYTGDPVWMQVHTNPTGKGNVKILGLRESVSPGNLGSFRWDTAFANYADSAVRTSGGVSNSEVFSLDFKTFVPKAVSAYRSNTGSCATDLLNCPKVRQWGSSAALSNGLWGPELELPTAGSPIRHALVKMSPSASYPEKTVVVTQANDGWLDLYVCLSNCHISSSWTTSNNVAQVDYAYTPYPVPNYTGFDFEFETASGKGILVWSLDDSQTTNDIGYRFLQAGATTLDAGTNYLADSDATNDNDYGWLDLDPNPTSNAMVLGGWDRVTLDVEAWVWNPTTPAFGNQRTIADGMNTLSRGFAVKYAADGTKAMVLSENYITPDYYLSSSYWDTSAATWTSLSTFALSGTYKQAPMVGLKADPVTDDLMAVMVDNGLGLETNYWSGIAWGTPVEHDTSIDNAGARPAGDFEWNPEGSSGKLVWDTDTTGTTLSYRIWSSGSWGGCSPCPTISSYAAGGGGLRLERNPFATENVDLLGLRQNSNFDLGSFVWSASGATNYGDAVLTADTADTEDVASSYNELFSLAFKLA